MDKFIDSGIADFGLRFAEEKDIPLILRFIKELAEYEELLHEVVATEEVLRESLFRRKAAEVIIAEYEGEPVDFALFFHNPWMNGLSSGCTIKPS